MNDAKPAQDPSAEQRVVTVASAMLRGELGVIEGSQLLCTLWPLVSSLHRDPDFLTFVAIDMRDRSSACGGRSAALGPDALVIKDKEIRAAEAFYRDLAFAGCERLLARFGSSAEDARTSSPRA
jgi:hypothetical protein